ncbi:PilW family protein [Planococcus alpniumensis]|uniref:PilW family protein n=1 Tax=Planococcus alpniumensis TaxID=2708345 RepID=UPI001B8C1E78|nr:prepilin-type N-terminal cleavage/methylation domain-containing protein [Planococcus sp. MSAK28401]
MGKLMRIARLDSKGLTLVEILAVLALLGIIITLSMNIFVTGKNTVDRQNTEADMQDSVTLAMKDITKQIRSAEEVTLEENDIVSETGACTYQFANAQGTTLETESFNYRFSNQKIYKNDVMLAENIGAAAFLKKDNIVLVKIESLDKEISLCTKILIRE